ncbi:protein transport protein S31 [Parelaphostrongylus tenuis]|uniref:Protein transport protein S31 n=1 Tax=Parelaphostrongylus tenuis TaxID=148309 RepID=A0AAD5WGV9_PARTN|nr:protein transport protein S31 [Parelaphostrongylus tenuis]
MKVSETVVDRLIEQKDYATAFMFAREQRDLLDRVTEKYIAEQLSASQLFLSLVSTANFEQLIDTFPRQQWSRIFALILSRTDRALMVHYMRKMALKWYSEKESDMLPAALAAIVAQDVELLLHASRLYSSDERLAQAIVLRNATGAVVNEEYETLLCTYCEKLIAGGVVDVAWRLLSSFDTKNERLLSLRHSLYFICGGEERTMTKEPTNPRSAHIQAISNSISFSLRQQRNTPFHQSTTPRSGSLTSAAYNQRPPPLQTTNSFTCASNGL